jgi:putative NADH-flavin reductase
MHLAIFGATGGVGRHLINRALEQGHTVNAFTRHRERLGQAQAGLRIVEGDALDGAAVRRAVTGSDAVLCALGMPLRNASRLRARGTRTIVEAMEAMGVHRLVCLSALGSGDSRAILPWYYRAFLVPFVMNRLFDDHEVQEEIVAASSLEWTLVRPGNFTNGPRTGAYRHGFTRPDASLTLKIAQVDVADFMLEQLTSDRYLHAAPALSC